MSTDLEIQRGLVIPGSELTWSAARASGAGGQHVNTTSTKVQLRFDFESSSVLPPDAKARLRELAAGQRDAQGRIVIESQATRSQARNIEEARGKLRALVRRALIKPSPRRPTKPSRAARRRRLEEKRKRARKKQARRTVRSDED